MWKTLLKQAGFVENISDRCRNRRECGTKLLKNLWILWETGGTAVSVFHSKMLRFYETGQQQRGDLPCEMW